MANAKSVLIAAVITLAATTAAFGEDASSAQPSADRGLRLAKALCVNCHLIGTQDQAAATPGVATFNQIANQPDQTADAIARQLIAPHSQMPDPRLTRAEIIDLVAYLDTLRAPDAGPPLLEPIKPVKPRPNLPQPG